MEKKQSTDIAAAGVGGQASAKELFQIAVKPPETLNNPLVFVVQNGRLLATEPLQDGTPNTAAPWQWLPTVGAELMMSQTQSDRHYLGNYLERDCIAVELPEDREAPAGTGFLSLYQLLMQLDDQMLGIAGRALQIVAWNHDHRYCGRCGGETTSLVEHGERARNCPSCKLSCYPRLAPCIIVLVHRGQELLLAHGVNHPEGLYSTLAGFVEAGENVEHAVHREVWEETGVQLGKLEYFDSQSWPFPNQLMLGFFAEYAGGQLKPDPAEIADANWWHYRELPEVPGEYSISGRLIRKMQDKLAGLC